jgi:hypothetical protein
MPANLSDKRASATTHNRCTTLAAARKYIPNVESYMPYSSVYPPSTQWLAYDPSQFD